MIDLFFCLFVGTFRYWLILFLLILNYWHLKWLVIGRYYDIIFYLKFIFWSIAFTHSACILFADNDLFISLFSNWFLFLYWTWPDCIFNNIFFNFEIFSTFTAIWFWSLVKWFVMILLLFLNPRSFLFHYNNWFLIHINCFLGLFLW